jgi:hypothetical protein
MNGTMAPSAVMFPEFVAVIDGENDGLRVSDELNEPVSDGV